MTSTAEVVVNGVRRELAPRDDRRLLAWLRDDLALTGTKYGCGEGACGACSVLIDGSLARACLVPLEDVTGRSVTTVEGLAPNGQMHPVQRAMVDLGAMQCGFCTPGMVVAAVALLESQPNPSDEAIKRWMAPNICRCCAYPRIIEAIHRATRLDGRDADTPPEPSGSVELSARPRSPWDLTAPERRDFFEIVGDGLLAIVPLPAAAPGVWAPTGGAWLHVAPDGGVTAFTGKVEVGQGTRRALRIVVAEELGVALTAVRLVMGDTDVCPFDIGTFGSMSMPIAANDLRRAAAGARRALQRDGAPGPGDCRVEIADTEVPLRPASERVGADDQVAGDPAAVTGEKRFVSDLTLPGMAYGQVLRPPELGARLRAVDVSRAEAMPGVTVVVDGDFVGVAAPTLVVARQAIAGIEARWDLDGGIAEADLEAYLRTHPAVIEGWGGAYEDEAGDVDGAIEAATVRLSAVYRTAYLAHAPLETRVALADWEDGRVTVWTGTQQPFGVRSALAGALGLAEQDVRVIVPDAGGAFGGKHEPDVAIASARLARARRGPVRLHWTREEEFTWAYFRPAAIIDMRAGVTANGQITAWEQIDVNAGSAAITTPYAVPNQRVRFQPAESPLRQGPYRALAATANTFARESFFDELARAVHVDPVELRRRHLHDERLAEVLRAATDRFGWDEHPRERGQGIGIAIGLEKGGRVATCAHVRVDDEIAVLRVVTAFECGAIVDRDNLRNQIEGATIMGIGGALFEAVHFDRGRILNPRFSQYRTPRFTDVPTIEVVLVDRPDLPPAGAGETPITAIAPAIANALYDATGRRCRSLPLRPGDEREGA